MKRFFLMTILLLFAAANGQEKIDTKTISAIPGGYENMTWGTKLSNAIDKIKGKIVFTDEKSIILSKEGELEYHYGFFYVDPTLESADAVKDSGKKEEEKKPGEQEKADEGTLFYVALKFPYLTMAEVKKRIEDKYGPCTNENLHKNQGALAWNGNQTIIVMWVDRYEDKPYCRRITYVDKKITKELSDYQFRVFNRVELAILRQMGI
ncbi:MAG: hypothetical protein A2176_05150 [Spirochaetes bacterium RBG_13_51_14]|nr:MAG: hypothetical protein A2176_05150 [Spirochaetes bacterium RBG_13_51_14]